MTREKIIQMLSTLDHIETEMIQDVHIQEDKIIVVLSIDPSMGPQIEDIRQNAEHALQENCPETTKVQIILTAERDAPTLQTKPDPWANKISVDAKHIIAVASGKGGVGKSTIAVNLARALNGQGYKTGLMDADIYGPSVPKMLGLSGKPNFDDDQKIIPVDRNGLKVMSMGFLLDEKTPMIWRGPMVQSAVQQMLRDVRWEGMDYLIIDMPPGTGDAQLTLAQKVNVSGAVIVSTPQDIALLDARKAIEMFHTTNVPILGLVENMSHYHCPECGHQDHIFGHGGAEKTANDYGVPLLGRVPLNIDIRIAGDEGHIAPSGQAHFTELAKATLQSLKEWEGQGVALPQAESVR